MNFFVHKARNMGKYYGQLQGFERTAPMKDLRINKLTHIKVTTKQLEGAREMGPRTGTLTAANRRNYQWKLISILNTPTENECSTWAWHK